MSKERETTILKNELNLGINLSKWELICLFNTIINNPKSHIIASVENLNKLFEDLNNDIITHNQAVESIIDLVDDSRFDEFYENVIAICRIADEEFNNYHLTKTVPTYYAGFRDAEKAHGIGGE